MGCKRYSIIQEELLARFLEEVVVKSPGTALSSCESTSKEGCLMRLGLKYSPQST